MNQKFTMKKLKSLLFAILFCAPLTAAAQAIEINAENFPDENFRNWLLEQDYGSDGVLTEEEIKGVTQINVNEKSIGSLKGIEFFSALKELSCGGNQLTTLDVSKNTALNDLRCSSNRLTELDVSKNTALTFLLCASNQISTLDVSKNILLTELRCGSSQLTTLDLSNNPALEFLYCYDSQLTSLDVSHNTGLLTLYCYNNQLTSLDVSHNTNLIELRCYNNQLTDLNVLGTLMRTLECYNNQLQSLDVVGCNNLTTLLCYNNQIKGESMDALISSLSEKSESKSLYVYYEDSNNEGNVCTKSQVEAATAKGWKVRYYNVTEKRWLDYEGIDANAAGIVSPELATENSNAPVYNLSGQKVTSPVKGSIYIVGGKKVVVK